MTLYERYSKLKLLAISLQSKCAATKASLITNNLSLTHSNEDLEQLNKTRGNLLGSIDIMKQLIDLLSREQINQLKDLISYGLATIFTDRSYSLDILISESRNVKQATFQLLETLPDGTVIRSDFKDSIGGGILSVVGLIIQVYYILYYSQYPCIFMDEALSQISSSYLPNVLYFIDQLAEKKHFKFILISHDDRLIEYGKHVYQVHSGAVSKVR